MRAAQLRQLGIRIGSLEKISEDDAEKASAAASFQDKQYQVSLFKVARKASVSK